jgi:hypothetical protein
VRRLPRPRGALVFLLCAAVPALAQDPAAASFARECESRLAPARISVTGEPMAPRIDASKSYLELTEMVSKGEYTWVLGLTRPVLRVRTQWSFDGLEDSTGRRTCMRPSLDMRLLYDPVTVFIGREFAADECSYRFILAHETRHVAVHVRQLENTVALLQSRLQQRMGGDVHYGTRAELERKFRTEIENYWMPRAQRELANVRREHAAIDTREEYARANTACDGRIARVLRRASPRGD